MIEKIEKIIKDNVELDNISIDLSTSFHDDLGLDSFEMAQLLCSVEDELKIDIDDADLIRINTVSDLINVIEKC